MRKYHVMEKKLNGTSWSSGGAWIRRKRGGRFESIDRILLGAKAVGRNGSRGMKHSKIDSHGRGKSVSGDGTLPCECDNAL